MPTLLSSLQAVLSLLAALHGNASLSTAQQQALTTAAQNVQSVVSSVQVVSPATVTVTSPSAGQSFAYGSTINIQWTPASAGVAEIQLVSTIGGESPIIYSKIVSDDPVDYSGSYSYLITGIPIGSYYVRLLNPENDQAVSPNPPGTVIGQSGVFTIYPPGCTSSSGYSSINGQPCAENSLTSTSSLSIANVSGLQTSYLPSQPISFTVDGIQSPGNKSADNGDNNVQAYISVPGALSNLVGENGSYNSVTGLWNVTLIAPSSTGTYDLSVFLYCANSLYCNANGVDQVSKSFNFTVASNASSSVTGPKPNVVFSANPTTITAGQSTALTWSSTNATYCTASGGSPSANAVNWAGTGSTSQTVPQEPAVTTAYVVTCTGSGGSTSASTTVTVVPTVPTMSVIKLLSPNGGQTYQSGAEDDGVVTISWSAPGVTSANNSFGLSVYNAANKVVFGQTVGDPVSNGQVSATGSYNWTIPSTTPAGSYLAYVSWQNGWAESAPFTILAASTSSLPTPSPATLAVSLNSGFASAQSVSPNAANVEVGSYTITAPSTQAVSVNALNIKLNGYGSYFQNLHVSINGAQFGTNQGVLGNNATYTFSGAPFTIPAGGKINLNVYADVLSTSNGSVTAGSLTTLAGCTGNGAATYNAVTCSPSVAGQSITIAGAAAITISADSSQPPAGQIVMGSTGNPLAVFRFTETSNAENVRITQLPVYDVVSSASANATFTNLTLWNGSTELGTVGSAGAPSTINGLRTYVYNFQIQGNPIIVPRANSVSITLKGDASPYSVGASDDIANIFEIATTTGLTALGQSSNVSSKVSLSSATGNTQTVLRTVLTPSVNNSVADGSYFTPSNHQAGNFTDDLAEIKFSANNAGGAILTHLTVTFSGSLPASPSFLGGVQLLDQNGINVVSDGFKETTSSACTGANTCTATWTMPTSTVQAQISAGSTGLFKLRINDQLGHAAQSGVSLSLNASIQSVGDVQYYDSLDNKGTIVASIPSNVVPVTIAQFALPQGLSAAPSQTNQMALILGSVQGFFGSLLNSALGR